MAIADIEDIQRRAAANAAAARRAAAENAETSPNGSVLAPVRHPQQDFFLGAQRLAFCSERTKSATASPRQVGFQAAGKPAAGGPWL